MSTHDPGSKTAPLQITEDEAALYDRQIRLWGLEAQQRMRNATILVVRLGGTATEVIKNIVLAGIGKLVIMDSDAVAEEDLGAGFFFRDEDVGKNRAEAAKARVQNLNPLVAVETLPTPSDLAGASLDAVVKAVDLVCVTDWSRDGLIRVNEVCRQYGKPFYAGGTYGVLGYIFCDLLRHEYIVSDRSAPKEAPKSVKMIAAYPPLDQALRHRWAGLTKRQTKELNPAVVFGVISIWEYEARHGSLPDDPAAAAELEVIANGLISAAGVNRQVITAAPRDLVDSIATSAAHEFAPVCAVVGGVLAQDILKALSAKEAPIANFFTFDGNTGGGTVCRMGVA